MALRGSCCHKLLLRRSVYSRYRKNCNARMLAAERNVQHLTKNAPVAANNRNEFRWSASGQKATLQGDRRMSGLPLGADITAKVLRADC